MTSPAGDDDWRLQGQDAYLGGVRLVRRRYRPPPSNPDWDHDHCSFCWATFAVPADGSEAPVGYATADEYHWICETCFSDFRDRFGWTLDAAP